ncbi:hypothetical protein [Sphingobium baderi]|uniref:hypothetical protein n=1 Tax=Sphingobium baderi TaxID=1332080 RepID=UPI002B406E03|nr:hypothetical protein [Sphingobium baderi]WRD75277.1 hypothetical protein QQ987_10750 [Sphingobium baderi]
MTINLKAAFRETDALIEGARPDMDLRVTPEMSASAQDFSFGKSVFAVVDGNPDGASVSGVAGISLIGSDEVDARGRKKDDNGISWDDLADLQREQREARERAIIENGRITMYGMTVAEEDMDEAVSQTLNNFDADAAKFGLEGKDKADYHYWLLVYQNAPDGSPQKATALEQMGAINEGMTKNILANANDRRTARLASHVSQEETNNAYVTQIADDADYERATSQLVDRADRAELAVQIRNGTSMAGSSDLAASFEAGFSASPEFNAAASGDSQQLAMAEPAASAQNLAGPAVL